MITIEQLTPLCNGIGARAGKWCPALNAAMAEFGIDASPQRTAMFLAQVAHESGWFASVEENLHYSAEGLRETFGSHFTADEFETYANQPDRIANRVYANRLGNGDEASGDGWRYRGAGPIQLTGAENQWRCADHFGIDRARVPDWLKTVEGGSRSAAWFWSVHGCNAAADAGDFDAVSDLVNLGHHTPKQGDAIGYQDRARKLALINQAMQISADNP